MMEHQRNISIDMLKFVAVLLIVNSHFDEQYTCFQQLATGGAIGDVLFFFCSGYTLFLGRMGRFDAWYKRRIRRIYPSILAWALLTSMIWNYRTNLFYALISGGEWFVSCILIYYVLLYWVRRYLSNHLLWVYSGATLIIIIWYLMFFDPFYSALHASDGIFKTLMFAVPRSGVWIYKWNYLKWSICFLFMLMGAHVGKIESVQSGDKKFIFSKTFFLLLIYIFLFYGIQFICERFEVIAWVQIISIIPLLGVCLYMYRLAKTKQMHALYRNKYCRWIMSGIGGLCLEIYLVQAWLRTSDLNHLFPLNLIILFGVFIIAAYICRATGRFIQQTFSSEDGYNWYYIFKF